MNKEEAMKILQHYLEMEEFNNAGDFLIAIDIALNLIQKQDKIIDKMAEQLVKETDLRGLDEDCFIPREYSSIDDCSKKQSCKD